MKRPTPEQRLDLFVRKANKLAESGFLRTLQAAGNRVTANMSWDTKRGYDTSISGPDDEQVNAVVLTARFFLQSKELAFGKIADLLDTLDGVDQSLVEQYRSVNRDLNAYLDVPIGLSFDGHAPPTRREVLMTVIYGDLSHANPDKAPRFERWTNNPFNATWIRVDFLTTLNAVVTAAIYLGGVVEKIQQDRPA